MLQTPQTEEAFMFEIVIGLFREFSPLTILLIVFVVLILLGSIVFEYKDGKVRFSYRWTGLRKRKNADSSDDKTDGHNKTEAREDKTESEYKSDTRIVKSEEGHTGISILNVISTVIGIFGKLR
jgi:hypothetical protein